MTGMDDTLYDAAVTLAALLAAAAETVGGWNPEVRISTLEPSFDCESIVVWPDPITPTRDNPCVNLLRVTFNYAISMCDLADRDEVVIFTEAETRLRRLWAVVSAIAVNCCDLLGPRADQVELGPVSVVQSGDVPVWRGTVTAVLQPL